MSQLDPVQIAALEFARGYKGTDCLLWTFGHGGKGRPLVGTTLFGTRLAHRIVCEMVNGPAPFKNAVAAHNCGNKKCINGSHVRWDTQKGNLADMTQHGTKPKGERHGMVKLTEAEVREIRNDNRSLTKIGEAYKVSYALVSLIKNRKLWKHVI